MKRLTSILAAVVATFLMGCQESNLTGPSAAPMSETGVVSKAAPDNNSNIIILQTTVVSAATHERFSVSGQIKYRLTQFPILSQELFDVTLDTQAKVQQSGSKEEGWTVNSISSEQANLTQQKSATVDKWYFLQGGPASLTLHVQFDVTSSVVSVRSMSIE